MKAPQADWRTASRKRVCSSPLGRSTETAFPPSFSFPISKAKMSSARPVACSLSCPCICRLRRRHSCPPPTRSAVSSPPNAPRVSGCRLVSSHRETACASSQLTVGGGTSLTWPGPEDIRTARASTTTGSTTRHSSESGFAAGPAARIWFPATAVRFRTQALPSDLAGGSAATDAAGGSGAGADSEAGRGGGRGIVTGCTSRLHA